MAKHGRINGELWATTVLKNWHRRFLSVPPHHAFIYLARRPSPIWLRLTPKLNLAMGALT